MWKERCQLVHWDSLLIQLNFMAFLKIHILPVEVMFCIETKKNRGLRSFCFYIHCNNNFGSMRTKFKRVANCSSIVSRL